MPEYLSPGVFIEEIPARLKAIEGVSTSTAGLAGRASRGPVPGFPLPFTPAIADRQVVPVSRDDCPVLVTSFSEFVRTFGPPPADPSHRFYLPHAARAFFDNGGKRAYISRVVHLPGGGGTAASVSTMQLDQGTVLRLARRAAAGQPLVTLTSLRGLPIMGLTGIGFRKKSNPLFTEDVFVASYDTQSGEITLTANLLNDLDPDDVFVLILGALPTPGGPIFHARTPGAWSEALRVAIVSSDRPPTPIVAPSVTDTIHVQSTGSFYPGAIVEVDPGGGVATRDYFTVVEIQPGNLVRLSAPVNVPAIPVIPPFARVMEIDVALGDLRTGAVETFKGLTWGESSLPDVRRRHYATVVNTRSRLAYVQPPGVGGLPGSEASDLSGQPVTPDGFAMGPTLLGIGVDGDDPNDDDFVGQDLGPGLRSGIQALQDIDDVRILAAPGETRVTVQNALVIQAERLRYRFVVLDGITMPVLPPPEVTVPEAPPATVGQLLIHRNSFDSSFAAYYAPWVQIGDGDKTVFLPPSGYVIGIYARTDNERGVWKAPANEVVRGLTGLRTYITTGEQDILNPRGVNCIRRFEGRGIRVWGARTLSSDPEFRYLNVRRFLIFMEASIDRGTQWVVFEPNSPETWSRVVDSVSAFLHTQWRSGALLGRKPEDAFYVRCDETTMTVDDVQNGRLICDIGVAIVRPAEFVIFRIEQITGFGKAS